jgi:hypothetical protein
MHACMLLLLRACWMNRHAMLDEPVCMLLQLQLLLPGCTYTILDIPPLGGENDYTTFPTISLLHAVPSARRYKLLYMRIYVPACSIHAHL